MFPEIRGSLFGDPHNKDCITLDSCFFVGGGGDFYGSYDVGLSEYMIIVYFGGSGLGIGFQVFCRKPFRVCPHRQTGSTLYNRL